MLGDTNTVVDIFHIKGSRTIFRYRFSAFWLRSKCSICSYQLNIWYVPHRGTSILNWFLALGEDAGACSDFPTGWPGIAVPPGSAHSLRGVILKTKVNWELRMLCNLRFSTYATLPLNGNHLTLTATNEEIKLFASNIT